MIDILPVSGSRMLDRFIELPNRLQRGDRAWIPPLKMERRAALSPRSNPYFNHAETAFWLARRDGRDVGRISAQIDRRVAAHAAGRTGHFGLIAAEDDPAVFAALFAAAEAWLAARGVRRVLGPFNLSINEECGLLVDGFAAPPMLLMGHDPPYAGPRIEALGYAKAKDLFAYLYDIAGDLPPGLTAMLQRPLPKTVGLRMLDPRRYADEMHTLCDIFNDAWSGNWGFIPLGRDEATHLAKSMRPLVVKELVWFVEVKGETAGFIVALPNINEAIADLDGRLLPFGWARLLWRLKVKGVRTARVPLMGIRKAHLGGWLGHLLPFLLIGAVRREGMAKGYRTIELSWILEDNLPMRRINEAIGSAPYKTYRLYEKALP